MHMVNIHCLCLSSRMLLLYMCAFPKACKGSLGRLKACDPFRIATPPPCLTALSPAMPQGWILMAARLLCNRLYALSTSPTATSRTALTTCCCWPAGASPTLAPGRTLSNTLHSWVIRECLLLQIAHLQAPSSC